MLNTRRVRSLEIKRLINVPLAAYNDAAGRITISMVSNTSALPSSKKNSGGWKVFTFTAEKNMYDMLYLIRGQ
jgi:hypothetical protein